jgi:hypothetical protein
MSILISILGALLVISISIGAVVGKRVGLDVGFDAITLPRRIFALAIVSLLVGGATFIVLNQTQKVVPTSDAREFQRHDQFGIHREQVSIQRQQLCRLQGGATVCTDDPRVIVRNLVMTVDFPLSVPVQKDFDISLEIASRPDPLPKGLYAATVLGPKYVEIRTSRMCKDQQEDSNRMRSCNEVALDSEGPVRLVWTATPTKTGEAIFSVSTELLAKLSNWSAGPDAKVQMKVSLGAESRDVKPTDTKVSMRNALVDLADREIRFPIEIVTSLGVSQATYDWVKVIAGVVAALGTLLGAGFAATLFKKRRSTAYDASD